MHERMEGRCVPRRDANDSEEGRCHPRPALGRGSTLAVSFVLLRCPPGRLAPPAPSHRDKPGAAVTVTIIELLLVWRGYGRGRDFC